MYMLGSVFLGAIAVLLLKHLSSEYSEWYLAWSVSILGVIGTTFFWFFRRGINSFRNLFHRWIFLRSFFVILAMLAFLVSLQQLSAVEASLLQYTYPLFTGIALGIIYKTRLRKGFYIGCGLAFIGIFLMTREREWSFRAYQLIALVGGVSSGISGALVRKVSRLVDPLGMLLSYQILAAVVCGAILPFLKIEQTFPFRHPFLLCLAATTLLASQLLLLCAYSNGFIAKLAILNYLTPLFVWGGELLLLPSFVDQPMLLGSITLCIAVLLGYCSSSTPSPSNLVDF